MTRFPSLRLGVRTKLFVASVVLIVSAGLPTAAYLEAGLRQGMEGRIETELERHARAAGLLLELAPADAPPPVVDSLADRLGASSAADKL